MTLATVDLLLLYLFYDSETINTVTVTSIPLMKHFGAFKYVYDHRAF